MPVLEFKDVSYSYNGHDRAVNDLSFTINEGEYISILGHNGSGKSTIAKLAIGLLKASKGDIIVDGLLLSSENLSSIRKSVSLVFQNPDNQFIGSTVEEDIAFGLENRNFPQQEMKELVYKYAEKVGMIDFLKKEPTALSGGQKQRVAIAGALITSPKILLLDEATSMLDPEGKNDINNLIHEMRIKDKSLTIISITHDIEEAQKSDKLLIIEDGKMAAFDKPEILLNDEKQLQKWHISTPFVYELKNKLYSIGVKVSIKDSYEKIVETICKSK